MIFGNRYMYPNENPEINYMMEDVFDDSDERRVALIVYNVLIKDIYNTLPQRSKDLYYSFLYNGGSNTILIRPKIENGIKGDGFSFRVFFMYEGVKYNITAFLCEPNEEIFGKTYAAYDTDTNILYLPVVKDIKSGIDCKELRTIEANRWTITHEIKHYIDYLKPENKDKFNNIPEDLDGYYNNEIEYNAFCQEAVDYITNELLKNIEKRVDDIIYFSDQNNVKEWLDRIFLKHFDEEDIIKKQRGELLDLAIFYQHLEEYKRQYLAKKIAEFYDKIVRPKFEVKSNIISYLLLNHKKAYKNPSYYNDI